MKWRYFWLGIGSVLAIIVVAWWASIPSPPELSSRNLSRLAAALGLTLLWGQYLLASRVKVLERGLGQDRLLRLHRWFGRVALGLVTIHFALILYSDIATAGTVFVNTSRLLGLASLIALSITALVASFNRQLGLRYETWKGLHLLNYFIFPVLLVHVFSAAPRTPLFYAYALIAVGYAFLFGHRALGLYRVRRNPYRVADVIREAEDIWSVHFEGPPLLHLPGQYMHVQLLRDGQLSSSHPFTISSAPGADRVSITPKEQGDFTATIGRTRIGDTAYIDAPYGVFSYHYHPPEDRKVFVAGGIGITPFMSMLRDMRNRDPEHPVLLLWGNQSESYLCFREELKAMESQMPSLETIFVMSRQPDWPGETGNIDAELIARYAGEIPTCRFYICGPPAMLRALLGELEKLAVPANRIHYEIFEL